MRAFLVFPDLQSFHRSRTPKELAYDLARNTDEAIIHATHGTWDAHRTYGPLKEESH